MAWLERKLPLQHRIYSNQFLIPLGAWWLGWIILGFSMLFFAGLIGLFPKHLPKKKVIRDTSETPRMAYVDEDIPFHSSEIHHIPNKRRVQEKEESPKMKGNDNESWHLTRKGLPTSTLQISQSL